MEVFLAPGLEVQLKALVDLRILEDFDLKLEKVRKVWKVKVF